MTIIVRAELRVRPGRVEEFLVVAQTLAAASADEPGTLRYCWYTSADPAVFVVLEEYTGPGAAVEHNERCAAQLGEVAELADMTSVHVHGDLGPEIEAWVNANPVAHAHPPL
ncbi:putative quinol monooxygenase [Pseudonocardia cypriaca]|uniref:Antibiotic biosynthesis monooxygenase n=1 Tax=Pseudonocardia cypriaca TaxID=882449 RepID=A0A543FW36_9PSEU|nr:antibiotic biosynthesis monooxygenase [Pseudonocardia cypriaca]TQM38050.1 antibiotic biosynthesis monooxygenase [Pseudonocardia cypriaca]